MSNQFSPLPQMSPQPEIITVKDQNKPETLDFSEAMVIVKNGGKVTKLEWKNPNIFVSIHGNRLCIKGYSDNGVDDGLYHPLLVSDGDLNGTDWYSVG